MSAASGTAVAAGVQDEIAAFVKTGSITYDKKCPWLIFQIVQVDVPNERSTQIIKLVKKGDVGQTYDDLLEVLAQDEFKCAYVLVEFPLLEKHKAGLTSFQKSYPVFVTWTLDSAKIKPKMLYSSSASALKGLLGQSCKVKLECHDFDDVSADSIFASLKLKS